VIPKIGFLILFSIVSVVSVARFLYLERSPPGFFIDESAGASNIICLRQTGHDGYGVKLPLFAVAARNAGGYFTPVFLYSGVIWTTVFGDSIFSFRAFAAFVTSLTILGLFFLVKENLTKEAAWFTTLAASVSPWAWQFSRISWDPPLMPLFCVWGMFFFLKSNRLKDSILSAVFLSLAMYSYPPGRVLVPLLVVGFGAFKYFQKRIDFNFSGTFLATFLIVSIPLFSFLLQQPESQARFGAIGITNPYYLRQFGQPSVLLILEILMKNVSLHFGPQFLFFSGDANLRHSTQYAGELGWIDVLGIAAFLVVFIKHRSVRMLKENGFVLLCVFGFFCAILPAALTWESIPHALRAIGAWPFLSCIVGYGLAELCRRNQAVIYLIVTTAALFCLTFGYKYFVVYPGPAYDPFVTDMKKWAEESAATGDWNSFDRRAAVYFDLSRKYFHMTYGKESCGQSPILDR
jgi:hypothetical protein